MAAKVLYALLLLLAGWFYFYICLRQLILNFSSVIPLIRKFGKAELISVTYARRLNGVAVVIWLLVCGGLAWVVLKYVTAAYLLVAFGLGMLMGAFQFRNRFGPRTPANFQAFCRLYYRFIPNDALRAAMYRADPAKIRAALRDLGSDLKLELNRT